MRIVGHFGSALCSSVSPGPGGAETRVAVLESVHVGAVSLSVAALTIAIEIVTNANGSPMICPAERPPPRR